jgi:hypothetical protein
LTIQSRCRAGRRLVTLRDAALYITSLPRGDQLQSKLTGLNLPLSPPFSGRKRPMPMEAPPIFSTSSKACWRGMQGDLLVDQVTNRFFEPINCWLIGD